MEINSVHQLSDYHLFELSQNERLDKEIRLAAQVKFDSRNLSYQEMSEIYTRHYRNVIPQSTEGMKWRYRLLLILVPFFFYFVMIALADYPARGMQRKWDSFWYYTKVGYWLWAIGLLLVLLIRR